MTEWLLQLKFKISYIFYTTENSSSKMFLDLNAFRFDRKVCQIIDLHRIIQTVTLSDLEGVEEEMLAFKMHIELSLPLNKRTTIASSLFSNECYIVHF